MKRLFLFIAALLLLSSSVARAQKFEIGTNLLQWANLGTYNGELSYAISRHYSIMLGARYNDRQIDKSDKHVIIQNRQASVYAGMRYWPWYTNSGLWFGGRMQLKKYASSGIWRSALEEATCAGLGASAGYTIMISKHFNIDFGLGFWGGYMFDYNLYDCPICMNLREHRQKFFIAPDEISVSLILVL